MSEPMRDQDPGDRRERASRGMGPVDNVHVSVISYLITGPALFGGIGWLLDRVLATSFLLPVGIVAGMALSIYLIWFRYGKT